MTNEKLKTKRNPRHKTVLDFLMSPVGSSQAIRHSLSPIGVLCLGV